MVSLVFIAALFPIAIEASSVFLHKTESQVLTAAQDQEILAAIGDVISDEHREATERRLAPMEALLETTLAALPKNEYGRFGHKSVRLALHRLFVQRHAWFVKGIELDGNWSAANPTSMLQDNVPEQVQNLFEERLGKHGLNAHEVAVMAATLEHLAYEESMERLDTAYEVAKIARGSANLTATVADSLLDVYMAAFVSGQDLSRFVDNKNGAKKLIKDAQQIYPAWGEVEDFARRMRQESTDNRTVLSSVDVENIVTRIGDQYGRWQDWECRDLKKSLLSIEDDGTGRVSLSKFYNGALNHGQWQFSESASYLRTLGALDESNPKNPRVIITNYILSPSNCVASSKYYSVCCIDECEDLIGHLENEIRSPAASPERIANLVAALASPTTPANRTLPTSLLNRLDEIAADNGGVVSLHGRLFALWMHHAYPRECPYPHLSGTTAPMKVDAYIKAAEGTDVVASATKEEMMHFIDARGEDEDSSADEGGIAWSQEDELYVERPAPVVVTSEDGYTFRTVFRFIAFLVPAVSMIAFLLHMDRTTASASGSANVAKFHV
jgi:hypothetical protein